MGELRLPHVAKSRGVTTFSRPDVSGTGSLIVGQGGMHPRLNRAYDNKDILIYAKNMSSGQWY